MLRTGELPARVLGVALRPLFLYWRDKHLAEYLSACARDGEPPRLHVGCAFSPIPGWFNCDLYTMSRAVNYLDATERLPFPDGSFQLAFTEHFIEHLDFEQGAHFMREAFRCLKPGGILRTATPSLEFVHDLLERRTKTHEAYIEWCAPKFAPGRPVSASTVVNNLFYGFGHRFIYDRATLEGSLRAAGFTELRAFRPGESETAGLRGVERHGKSVPPELNELETMVIEARRP